MVNETKVSRHESGTVYVLERLTEAGEIVRYAETTDLESIRRYIPEHFRPCVDTGWRLAAVEIPSYERRALRGDEFERVFFPI